MSEFLLRVLAAALGTLPLAAFGLYLNHRISALRTDIAATRRATTFDALSARRRPLTAEDIRGPDPYDGWRGTPTTTEPAPVTFLRQRDPDESA